MKRSLLPLQSALAISLCAAFAPQAFAAAGTAQFTAGDVQLKRADGGLAPLAKGREIDSGQSVVTGSDGRAQVRFTDGGLISLQPSTEFKIASYVDKLDAKEDRFLVDLLRGSMRAITGLIGKRNRDNYKVNTATATIGIRGSGFNVGYNPDGTLSVTTELDAIEVCTAAGCVGLTAGESVRVLSNSQAPVRTNVRATFPTPPPAQEAQLATQQAGLLAQIKVPPAQLLPEPLPSLQTSVVNDMQIESYASNTSGFSSRPVVFNESVSATFLGNGDLLKIETAGFTYTPSPGAAVQMGALGSPNDANFIGWGSWTPTTVVNITSGPVAPLTQTSYVIGRPTGPASLPANLVANYIVAGATTPITRNTSTGGSNTASFLGAGLSIDFSQSKVNFNVNTSAGNLTTAITGSADLTASRSFEQTLTGGQFQGFAIGPNADRAGVTYSILAGNTVTTGAIAFRTAP